MPEISRFLGVIIGMYYRDHPPPHFHAKYGDYEVLVNIETGEIIRGRMPRRALSLVEEWRQLHKEELLADWRLAETHRPLSKIEPLE
jgi:hypothetical protein